MTTAAMIEPDNTTQHHKKRRRAQWERAFLTSIKKLGNVSAACAAAEIERSTAYRAREKFADFAAEWDEALEMAADAMEAEAQRRATQGVDEPVFYKGVECGAVRKYSDTLLIFLLKAARPKKFRESAAGTSDDPIVQVSMTLEQWKAKEAERMTEAEKTMAMFDTEGGDA